jgi:LacI family transcriptional regulator
MQPVAVNGGDRPKPAKRRRTVTMDDVARAAGVSKSAVSRALNRVPGAASPTTSEKVRRAAEELGYVPNAIAASLKHRRTRTIGFLLSDLGNPFFALVAAGFEEEIRAAGYTLLIANTGYDQDREVALTRTLLARQVDALLVASAGPGDRHLRLALDRGVHVVLVDSHPRRISVDCVMADNRDGAGQAVRHLLELGHEDIGIITGWENDSSSVERLDGARETLRAAGLDLPEERTYAGDFGIGGGADGARRLLALRPRPTALFVTNNLMTLGAMRTIGELGLRVPRHVSLVAFDDMDWFPIAKPPITAVSQPAYEIGRRAARELLDRLQGTKRRAPRTILLETELIVRASTAPPSRAQAGSRRAEGVRVHPSDEERS